MTRKGEVIFWRVMPARDGCQEAMIGCPGLCIQSLGGIEGCPSMVGEIVGVEWWEDFRAEIKQNNIIK